MGRRDQWAQGPQNPVEMTFMYHGTNGQLYFLKKNDANETEKVFLPHDAFSFYPITAYMTVKGYNMDTEQQVWSNRRGLNDHAAPLKVRLGQEVFAEGAWKDIKNQVAGIKGKYTEVVIAWGVMNETGNGKLVAIEMNGAAFGAPDPTSQNGRMLDAGWTFFKQEYNMSANDYKVSIDRLLEGRKGAVKFQVPLFKGEVCEDEELKAMLDSQYDVVDEYLKAVIKSAPTQEEEELAANNDFMRGMADEMAGDEESSHNVLGEPQKIPEDDLPF